MNTLRASFILELMEDPSLKHLGYNRLWNSINDVFIVGKNVSKQNERDIDKIINSEVYSQMYNEFLDHAKSTADIVVDMNLTKNHESLILEHAEAIKKEKKQAYILELASQHKNGEMMPQISFYGHGVFYMSGFLTDVSENCIWLTPFVTRPSDKFKLR